MLIFPILQIELSAKPQIEILQYMFTKYHHKCRISFSFLFFVSNIHHQLKISRRFSQMHIKIHFDKKSSHKHLPHHSNNFSRKKQRITKSSTYYYAHNHIGFFSYPSSLLCKFNYTHIITQVQTFFPCSSLTKPPKLCSPRRNPQGETINVL